MKQQQCTQVEPDPIPQVVSDDNPVLNVQAIKEQEEFDPTVEIFPTTQDSLLGGNQKVPNSNQEDSMDGKENFFINSFRSRSERNASDENEIFTQNRTDKKLGITTDSRNPSDYNGQLS